MWLILTLIRTKIPFCTLRTCKNTSSRPKRRLIKLFRTQYFPFQILRQINQETSIRNLSPAKEELSFKASKFGTIINKEVVISKDHLRRRDTSNKLRRKRPTQEKMDRATNHWVIKISNHLPINPKSKWQWVAILTEAHQLLVFNLLKLCQWQFSN